MNNIRDILKDKRFKVTVSSRPINPIWEQASEFGSYVGLSTPFVLRLFKVYGIGKVLALRSYLKDCNADPKRYPGLVVWKLKNP